MAKAKEIQELRAKEDLAQAIESHMAGRLVEAEELYRKVLREHPTSEIALNNLSVMANQLGNHETALTYSRQVLAINPDSAQGHNNMGNALAGMGRAEDAIASYRQALRFRPDYPEALHNCALELHKDGCFEDAVIALEEAIRLNPGFSHAYNALGISLQAQGKIALAIEAYQKAIQLNPTYFVAFNNLANALSDANRLEEAISCYQKALRLKPDYYEAFNNMGNALVRLGRTEPAMAAFTSALAFKPDLTESRSALTMLKQGACDWSNAETDEKTFLECLRRQPWGVDPFFLLSQNATPGDQLLCARHFAKRASVPEARRFRHMPDKSERVIRIGYISGNFQQHPNAYLSVGVFENHDRMRFEVTGYSYGCNDNSDIRLRLEKSFDRFFDIRNLTHAEAAQKIHGDGIDILIDRQGYTLGHRMGILACRPAPIQVNYLGFAGTMGAEYIDYIIADRFVVPADEQQFFTEKLVHLPHCYQGTDDKQTVSAHTPTRAGCGLPAQGFVFCCFNNTHKIRPAFFDIWMRLLSKVPGSVLWLLNKNTLVRENLSREAARRGVDPMRLIFAPMVNHAEHLARHRLADLFLDTLPYNAHTTASDALWTGLPLITCVGHTFAGRVAGSILSAIGLPELVTTSLQDYEALALKLATEPEKLAAIRGKLEKNRLTTPLFDTPLYTRHLEDSYMQMWKCWQSGSPPQPVIVTSQH